MTSIVLAGGRSSRLGKEKHAEIVAGKSLIQRVIERLGFLSTEILIVVSSSQSASAFSSYTEAKTVVDIYPGKGSLGGIFSGLAHSTSFHSLTVGCDMPFLSFDLLRYMIELSPGFDVVIPRVDGLTEPLHAVYSKSCLDPMERLLERGNQKITAFFDVVRVRYVEKEEIDRFDPDHLSFFNVNTRADLDRARSLASKETGRKDYAGHRN